MYNPRVCAREGSWIMCSNKRRKCVSISSLALIFASLATAPALRAQAVSVATVTGRVTDQQGALVPSAEIKITGADTGTVRDAVTNTEGIYTLPSLPIGAYSLQVTAPGFQKYVQTGILLRV